MGTRRSSIVRAVFIGLLALSQPARAQTPDAAGALSEVPLPGGLRGALAAIGDGVSADRSQFLLEFIRRTYHAPVEPRRDPRTEVLRRLLDQIDRPRSQDDASVVSPDTLPLPLSAAIWTKVVFGGRETPTTLVAAILRSRNASLLYYGLLELDDGTRAWLATQPDVIRDLASVRAPAFAIAASGLRVADAAVAMPGGPDATKAWEALVSHSVREPAAFIRAALSQDRGRLAYFIAVMAEVPPDRLRLVLRLDSADVAARTAAIRRLYAVFGDIAPNWNPDGQTFWRPTLDPGLLLTELPFGRTGQPALPGTAQFWTAVFADRSARVDPGPLVEGERVDPLWLIEQVFGSKQIDPRARYDAVLFASRMGWTLTQDTAHDGLDALRAAVTYPALVMTLERAGVVDVGAYGRAGRRAGRLAAIANDADATRSVSDFQGVIALLARAATRGGLTPDALSVAVRSVSEVDVDARGEYQGRLVHWVDAFLRERRAALSPPATTSQNGDAGLLEEDLLRVLAGPAAVEPRVIEWEGTRYRVDLEQAELLRLRRLLGDGSQPYLSSARDVVGIADDLHDRVSTPEDLKRAAAALGRVGKTLGWTDASEQERDSHREAEAALERAASIGDVRAAPRLAVLLYRLGDDLLARGLLDFVYAAALGQPDRSAASADDVANRHDLGLRFAAGRAPVPWQIAVPGSELLRGWRVSGSLFSLDVALADFLLVPLSAKPLPRPTLSDADRRELTRTVALVKPGSLTDADRDTIVRLIARGRERLAAIRTPLDAGQLADEIRLGNIRHALLRWTVQHDPERLPAFLSTLELLWAGLEGRRLDGRLDAWGVAAGTRIGCLCLQLIAPRTLESLAGRSRTGFLMSAFPDLSLRLAELMAELHMPAILLGPVLESATLDFVNRVPSRDEADRRGPTEFVQALRVERLEEYLALLTTDGPLVPLPSR